MKTYYIFRHGKAIEDGMEYGENILTASLLPQGVASTTRLGAFVKTIPETKNISSEIHRCRQTVQIVSEITGKKFSFDSRLNEFNNETFEELKNRVKSFLTNVANEEKPLLICTHGAVIAALKNLILTNEFYEKDVLDYILPGEMLIIKETSIEIKNFNEI